MQPPRFWWMFTHIKWVFLPRTPPFPYQFYLVGGSREHVTAIRRNCLPPGTGSIGYPNNPYICPYGKLYLRVHLDMFDGWCKDGFPFEVPSRATHAFSETVKTPTIRRSGEWWAALGEWKNNCFYDGDYPLIELPERVLAQRLG